MKNLYGLCIGLMLSCSSIMVGSQEWQESLASTRQQTFLQLSYEAYDQCKEYFVHCLPLDVNLEEIKEILDLRKVAVGQELSGLFYKNVIFSKIGIEKMGMLIVGMGNYNLGVYRGYNSYVDSFIEKLGSKSSNFSGRVLVVIPTATVLQSIAGFGLYKDIKAMREQKNQLSAELEKINKMLELLITFRAY